MNDVRRQFMTLASREPVPLGRAALLIAKEEYPELDVDTYLGQLDDLAQGVRHSLPEEAGLEETVVALYQLSYRATAITATRPGIEPGTSSR